MVPELTHTHRKFCWSLSKHMFIFLLRKIGKKQKPNKINIQLVMLNHNYYDHVIVNSMHILVAVQ